MECSIESLVLQKKHRAITSEEGSPLHSQNDGGLTDDESILHLYCCLPAAGGKKLRSGMLFLLGSVGFRAFQMSFVGFSLKSANTSLSLKSTNFSWILA